MNTATNPPPPAPPTEQTSTGDPPRHAILFKSQIPFLVYAGTGADVFAALLQAHLCRALRDKGVLCSDQPSEKNSFTAKDSGTAAAKASTCIGIFEVTDLSAGLDAIKAAFSALKAAPYCEIGYLDYDTRTWHCWHPRYSTEPFARNVDLIFQWAKEAGLLWPQTPPPQPPEPTQ